MCCVLASLCLPASRLVAGTMHTESPNIQRKGKARKEKRLRMVGEMEGRKFLVVQH